MSVNSYLEGVANNAIIRDSEKEGIKTSVVTLRSRLNAFFGNEIKDQIIFGSYSRGTILPRKMDSNSDVDYMVVFKDSSYKPQTYLEKLRRFATAKYGSSEIFQSTPTIVLSLNNIRFELVPAIDEGQFYTLLKIPAKASAYQDWISTDPTGFNDELIAKNITHNSKIKPLIRLLKRWNATHALRPFESYELEKKIVGSVFSCAWVRTPNLADYFFEFIKDMNPGWSDPKYKTDAIERAKKIVAQTKEYEENEMPYSAEAEIKKLIPDV